jgi:general secretion pathway protein D
LINTEDDNTVTGIPGLSNIPLLGKLFSGSSVNHNRDELMIVLIPHIIRRPEISADNLRPVATGNQLTVKLTHEAAASEAKPAAAGAPANAASPSGPAATTPVPAAAPANPAVEQPAGALPATAPPLPPSAAPPPTGGTTPQSPGAARVHFMPSQVDTDVGSTVTVSLAIDGASDVASAPMIVTWDSKLLKLNGIDAGDLLAQKGQLIKNIQNDQGRASVQLNVPPNSPGVTALSGTLVKFNFQAVGHGATQVTVPQLNVRNSQGGVVVSGSPQLTVNIK